MAKAASVSDKPEVLHLRPHHLLCSLGYEGEGYSDGFTANMTRLVTQGLKAPGGDGTVIEITPSADAICAPCPHRRGQGCEKQAEIDTLDRRHLRALDLAPGARLRWSEAKARIRAAVRPGGLAQLCQGCRWLDLGLCDAALVRLHREDVEPEPE